jgi:hypothetical protein
MTSKNFYLLTIASLSFMLLSCSSDVRDINSFADNSAFELSQIEMVSAEVRSTDPSWPDLKNTAVVSFRTCVTDTAYLERVPGERFLIQTSQGPTNRISNAQGCLNWSETIEFNYLEDEKFIELSGSISGLGGYRGVRNYRLAVNPWRENVVDLSYGRVNSVSNALRQQEESLESRIAVTNATLSVLKQNFLTDQTLLELEVTTQPMMIRRNLTGSLIREAFNAGHFKVNYFLITRNISTNRRRVVTMVEQNEIINQEGRLKSRVRFVITEGIQPKDVVELGIRVSAHNAPVNLGMSEGLLPIKQLDGTVASELLELPENLETLSLNTPMLLTSERSENEFGFIIDSVTIRPGAEGGENSSGMSERRTVDAIFQVCMVDSLIKVSVPNYPFSIRLLDDRNQQIFSGQVMSEARTGCANFRATIPYRRFDPQRWLNYRIEVSSTREPFVDISKDRLVSINPWIRTGDFGIDRAIGTPPAVTNSGATRPRIVIHNVNYNLMGISQSGVRINKAMDLLFNRSYMIEMQPMIQVNHRFDGEMQGQERLVSGRYRMRLLILAPRPEINVDFTSEVNLRDFYTLTAVEQNVGIEGGILRTRVELPLLFTDLIPFSHKNIMLVELTTLESGSALQTGYLVGTFVGSRPRDNVGSSLESRKTLSTGNVSISQVLVNRIRDVRNKLAADSVIPNNRVNLKQALQNEIRQRRVPVIDHENHRVVQRPMVAAIFDDEQSFKNQGMLSSVAQISQFISNPNSRPQTIINDICHAFYPRTQVTRQTTTPPAMGMGMSMPIDTSITGFEHKRCMENFREHFDITQAHHVASIVTQPTALQTDAGHLIRNGQTVFTTGRQVMNSMGARESNFFQSGWSAHVGMDLFKPVFIGGSLAVSGGYRSEVYTMDFDGTLINNLHNRSVMHGQRYVFDRFTANFAARVVKCVMINPKMIKSEIPARHVTPTILDALRRRGPELHSVTANKVVYLCKGAAETENYSENYYFLKTGEQGVMSDVDDISGKLIGMMRGEKAFARFRKEILESDKTIIFEKFEDPSLLKRFDHHMSHNGSAIEFDKRLDFTIPGLIER